LAQVVFLCAVVSEAKTSSAEEMAAVTLQQTQTKEGDAFDVLPYRTAAAEAAQVSDWYIANPEPLASGFVETLSLFRRL